MIYLILGIIILLLTCYFVFFKKSTTAVSINSPLPQNLKEQLTQHIEFYRQLDGDSKNRFESLVQQFLNTTRIEGVGTEITDQDRAMVASSAVIPVFGFPDWRYGNLTNVILYPDTFDNDFQFEGENRNIMGMVGSGYMNGQMLLSRAALQKGFSPQHGSGNTAIHEFVHLLDKADGATDGVPESLMQHSYAIPWLQLMHREMHKIKSGKSDINPYALTNEAEFLAVAAEYFFEKPEQLKNKHPELYDTLSSIFQQSPAEK